MTASISGTAVDTFATNKISGDLVPSAQFDDMADAINKLELVQFGAVNVQSGTTYTLVAADWLKVVEFSNGSAITVTVPLNSSVAFLVGTVIELFAAGAGQVTVAPAGGVTIRTSTGLKLFGQYSSAVLRKRATDEWVLSGDVTA